MARIARRAVIAFAAAAPALLRGPRLRALPRYAFPPPIDIQAAGSPWPAMADGRLRLLYELRVTNFPAAGTGQRSLELRRLEVTADGRPVAAFEDAGLAALLTPIGPPGQAEARREVLLPGRGATVFLDLVLPAGAPVPHRLTHRLFVADPDGGEAVAIPGPDLAVVQDRPPLIGPPLRGSGWAAAFGLSDAHHRRVMTVRAGRTWIASRFAIDWVRLGPDGRLFSGDPAEIASYFGYGAEVIAAADGLVVEARDQAPDNRGNRGAAGPLDLDDVAGNSVILKLGPGRYAVYDHLRQGSVRVRRGQRVRAGQVLAQVGNSGDTGAPHLHFHMMDGPVHNGAEGIPYGLRAFTELGAAPPVASLLAGEAWRATSSPLLRRGEFPLDGAVVAFDAG